MIEIHDTKPSRSNLLRVIARWFLASLYMVAGYFHLILPQPFLEITPLWVPYASLVIYVTGWCEIAGALALIQPWIPRLRRWAGWSLAAYALCVWPANINHMLLDLPRPGHGAGLAYHIPRLLAQPVLIWLALWVSNVIDWPCRSSTKPGPHK